MAQEASAPPARELAADAPAPRFRLSTFQSLKYRNYRLLWLGQTGASASLWMEQVARPVLILELTNSALMVGLLTATRTLPMLLVGLWAGVVADRVDKRRILLTTQSVTLVSHLTTGVLILSGAIEPWMVFVTTFTSGASMAFNQPARQSLVPRLVPAESLANAVALNSAVMNVMRIGGASLAGLVLALFDIGYLYILQTFMYVWVMLWTYQISVRTQEGESGKQRGSMRGDLMEGFAYVRNDPTIFYMIALAMILFVWGFPYQSVFVPLIAIDVLDIGRSGAGWLISLTGVGALIGSLSIATSGGVTRRQGIIMLAMLVIYSAALMLLSRGESLLLVAPVLLLIGALQVSYISTMTTFILSRTTPELHGRVMSLLSLDRGLIPLGATVAGVLASTLGPQDGLLVMGFICFCFTTVAILFIPAVRRIT